MQELQHKICAIILSFQDYKAICTGILIALDFCAWIKTLDAIFLDLEMKVVNLNGRNSMLLM
jgi:hypothetical protein